MIFDNYQTIRKRVAHSLTATGRSPEEVEIIAISKQQPPANLMEVYAAGGRDFGENRVPEALEKMKVMPRDIRWHYIGALQSKKVPKVIGKFSLIHSVDTFELAQKIDRAAGREGVKTAVLLQVNTSMEVRKRGLDTERWRALCAQLLSLKYLDIQGLMTMAPHTENKEVIRGCFSSLRRLKEDMNSEGLNLTQLSMGMTNDFLIGVEEGATLLRIGSAIFS